MDQEYIDALANGDSGPITELYCKCFGDVKKWIEQNNGNEDDAKDIYQDTLEAIFTKVKANDFKLTCPICYFILLVCKRKWINELKKRGKRGITTFTEAIANSHLDNTFKAVEIFIQEEEQKKLFESKIQQLNEKKQALLSLSWSGVRLKKIAEMLHITYESARTIKCGCMKELIKSVQADPDYKKLKW